MANKKLMDEDLRQANKSTSTLKTQAFKLANGTRYKATAADGEMGKFAGNNPAYPAGYMNVNPMLAKNGFFLPSGFVPVSLNGFQQPQPRPQNVINQPGFNPQMQVISPTASTMPPVMVNQPQRPTTRTTPAPFQTPSTNGFMAPTQSGGILSGDKQGQVNSTTNTGTPNLGQPQRPEGTYNPNNKDTAAQWRAYWNWEAANPQAAAAIALAEGRLSSAPVVMTREQIWQMKAAQRRKRASMNYEAQSYVSPVSAASPYTGTGEFYSTILNTGSG